MPTYDVIYNIGSYTTGNYNLYYINWPTTIVYDTFNEEHKNKSMSALDWLDEKINQVCQKGKL